MNLVQVERFFNGSKIIFSFRRKPGCFRELVKALVNEFRVRVEMRQIGVRHETRMIGGIAPAGGNCAAIPFYSVLIQYPSRWPRSRTCP